LTGWLALLLAGLLEIAWALGLKYSDGLTRLWPSLAMLIAIGLSFALLGFALKSVSFGTAYALWTGIGAAGTVIIGMLAFGEPASIWRVTCLSLIIAGMVGLKLTSDY
jgi:quaternary ammonium compound-resistance protein SugE